MKQTLNYLKTIFLLLNIICFTSCENDQNFNSEIHNLKTITFDEAKEFLNSKLGNANARTSDENYIKSYSDYLSHQEIINNSEYMTEIPAVTVNQNMYSRILMLSINGETQSVVYSMLFDETSTEDSFTGEILITDLDGNFLNGYIAENGQITMQYILSEDDQNRLAYNFNRTNGDDCSQCPFTNCSYCGELNTVVVTGQSNNSSISADALEEFIWSSGAQAGWNIPDSGSEIDWSVGGGANLELVLEEPDNPIADIQEFLECFNTSQSASFTIYALEPNPGSGEANAGSSVGHAFVSITQGSNTSTFGFYPVSNWINPCFNYISSNSILGNDGGGAFTASYSTNISATQLLQILNQTTNFNANYNLNSYNCTDFAIELANLAGLNFPACNGTWPCGGSGSNPGALGMEIRNRNTTNGNATNPGTAPISQKGC